VGSIERELTVERLRERLSNLLRRYAHRADAAEFGGGKLYRR
jgi:hypothetical protein